MRDLKWNPSEKKLARRVFDAALASELADLMAELKARAAAASQPEQLWEIQDFLYRRRREIDQHYDFRYSQLPWVFGRLLRDGRIQETQLDGLGEDKLGYIRTIAAL